MNPSLIDLAAVAFYSFTQLDFFEYETAEEALTLLNSEQINFIRKFLAPAVKFADIQVDIDDFFATPEVVETINESECDASETSSFGVCTEDEIKEAQNLDEPESDYDVINDSVATAIENEDDDDAHTAIENDDDLEIADEDDSDEVCTAIGEDESVDDVDDEASVEIISESDEVRTAIGAGDEVATDIDDDDDTQTAVGEDDDVNEDAINDGDDYVATAVDAEETKDDFEICDNPKCGEFGLQIPNLANVFKYRPEFHISGAILSIEEDNTLVYTRHYSNVTYRKLTVFCEGDDVVRAKYEHCCGSNIRGKCTNTITYKQ